MATTRVRRLVVVGIGLIALISLMLISVDQEIQYTVDEVMGAPEDFTSDEIHPVSYTHLTLPTKA